jgi:chloramphenicol-sensitive protein RarD
MRNLGFVYAISAYFIWGIAPLFWRLMEEVPSVEIVAHRMLWSAVFVTLLILVMGQRKELMALIKNRSSLIRLFFASILISINWGVYIWSINNEYIVEASMGYFINPLLNVVFGVIVFKESLRFNQWLAIGLAFLGVAYLILVHGDIPWVALVLAFSFGSYAAVKKSITVPATHGLAIESGLLALPALGFLIYLSSQQRIEFGGDLTIDALLIFGGIFTLVPLVLFAAAAKRISFTALGMTQYLGPSLQLLIGVLVYQEEFGSERQISFGLIWAGLLFYTLDQLNHRRKRRAVESAAGMVVKAD